MFRLISFQASGERVTHAGQRAAFFGLTFDGMLVEYFTSVQAATLAKERCQAWIDEATARERTVSLQLAA